jgi:membrane protein YqaA with SNARE-associated domain
VKAFIRLLISWGPLGVFVLAMLDSVLPLPATVDALLVTIAAADPSNAWLTAMLAVFGSVTGSMALYYAARKGGETFLDTATVSGRGLRLRCWFQRYGLVTIFVPAFLIIPLPLKVPVLCAGALRVRPLTFFSVVLVARVLRYSALAYLGAQVGEHSLGYLRKHVWEMMAVAVVLSVLLFALIRFNDRTRRPGFQPIPPDRTPGGQG